MNIKNSIKILLEGGLPLSFVSKLNVNQIKLLSEKYSKKERNEVEIKIDPKNPKDVAFAKNQGIMDDAGNVKTNLEENGMEDLAVGLEASGKIDPNTAVALSMDSNKNEVTEKFQSKDQQGLFWARCNKCKNKNCKWCSLSKEFSSKTTKKDYETMPQNKDEVTEKFLEDSIVEMVESYLTPKMTKKEIMSSIQNKIGKSHKMKKPIGKVFSMGKEMSETDSGLEKNDFMFALNNVFKNLGYDERKN